MAEAVVSFVLKKLGEPIIDGLIAELKFLLGAKKKLEDAKRELGMIRCFLKDADARARNGDETLALWVQEIIDAAYDLDDVVSTFVLTQEAAATKGVVHKIVGGIKRPFKRHKVGFEIDEILNRLSKLNQNLQSYGVLRNNNVGDASSSNQRRNDLRRTYAHIPEDDFVENKGGMMKLVTQLTKEGNSSSPFVSIHGMGGLGKSTLAKKVYHHKQVREHFNCFAWVFVSQQFIPKDIWKGVLLDLVSDPSEKQEIRKMEQGELAEKLYAVLQEQKCLVVLDDVWNTDDWDRSKILITTRRRDVGEHADTRSFLYQPRHLNDVASWELLKKKAFFHEDATSRSDYKDMEKLGKDMVKCCGGLPLAIVVLGGLLSTKHTVDEWEAVKQNVKELINKGQSIGEQEYNTVFAVLGLSYDELPYDLKPCFLHLANFPEDYEINVKELCRLWTAEDFVPAMDEARKYLMALVDRGMVQVGRRSLIVGRIKTCRIHDLMRDLCLEKAKNENFFHLINFKVSGDSLPNSKFRRLAVQFNDNKVDGLPRLTNNRDGCLRSLLCFAADVDRFDLMKLLINRFNMLRVFKFEVLTNGERYDHLMIPEEIGKLVHLRFFSLKDCVKAFGFRMPIDCDEQFHLPSSLVNLRCLETLDLRTGGSVYIGVDYMGLRSLQSMNVLSEVRSLRHLYLPDFCGTHRLEDRHQLRLDKVRNLETLINFNTVYCKLYDLSKLTKLTKLSIRTIQALGAIKPASNLQSLCVKTFSNNGSISDSKDFVPFLSSYPKVQKLKLYGKPVNSLEKILFPNLVKLTMGMNFLEVDPMPILAKLSKLRILALSKDAYAGKIMVCCKDSFPQLESLSIEQLPNLEEWRVEEGASSKLCRLEMYCCKKLNSYPDGLRNITTLKEIKLTEMGEDFMRSFGQKGGDEDSTSSESE
ncbi:hypothetical protein UlMin_029565 [Ulmus minor]